MTKALHHRKMTWLPKVLIAVILASLVVAKVDVRPVHAFAICKVDTVAPWQQYFHLDCGHENVTASAVIAGTSSVTTSWSPSDKFLTDLARGVENTDIEHQFDCDSHFDNSTVVPIDPTTNPIGQAILCTDGSGHYGFDAGFATLRQRIQFALSYALGNPQFLNPTFITFHDVVSGINLTLASLITDLACAVATACPTADLLSAQVEMLAYGVVLGINPNPDPIPSDSPNSPLRGSPFPTLVHNVVNDLISLLGPHMESAVTGCGCMKTLAEAIGSDNPLVMELQNELDQVRAYIAFQYLGHVFHTTEDFFAHSNYVELMATAVHGTTVLISPSNVLDIFNAAGWPACNASAEPALDCANLANPYPPIPSSYDGFTLSGMQAMLSQYGADSASLQTGAVVTRWLGEGNYCGSTHDIFFNPAIASIPMFTLPTSVTIAGHNLWGDWTFPGIPSLTGAVTDAPPGFRYCHYQTATAGGLNKDEPGSESQQVNYAYAFGAATRMAEELWTYFLGLLSPLTTATASPTPVDGIVAAHQVTLTLTATDMSGRGIANITYAAAGANPIAPTTVTGASAQITISTFGDTYVVYSATDNVGVQEPIREYDVRLRSTAANPMYDYKVIALTSTAAGPGIIRSLGIGPSINDWGEVAFTGTTDYGSAIYLADATGHVRLVNPGWSSNPSRRFEDIVTVNNGDAIAVGDRISSSTRIRIWDARPGVIDTYQTMDASGAGSTSAATVTFDPGFPGVPAAGIVGMMTAQPAGFTVTPGTSTPGNGFDAVITSTMNDKGAVAWAGLSGNQWDFASGTPGNVSTSAGQLGPATGPIRQTITDDDHIIARASGDGPSTGEPFWAADAPVVMWDLTYGNAQTIVCQSGCAHPGFTAVGRFVGASKDSAVIAFAASGPQGVGIYASVRTQIGQATTADGRVVVPVAIISSTGPLSAIEGQFRIAVNSTQKSGERAVEIAFMADSSNGDKGLWVTRLRFPGNADGTYDSEHLPSAPQADPLQMVVQQGSNLPGLQGTIGDVWYYDPINNRNTGDLAFWVSMTTGTQAIVRARPQCGSTDYAPGTEPDSTYINQYDAGNTLGLPKVYNRPGGNACGPTSLSMAINNIQHARGQARTGKMANLVALYGDGTTSCVIVPFAGGYCTFNGVMVREDGQNIPITHNVHAMYDRSRAEAILSSAGWTYQETQGVDQLNAALDSGMQVVQSTTFGTAGQAYGNNGVMAGSFGGGHMVLFSGRTPMGDYIVEDPAGDYFQNPTAGGTGTHYGPGICGKYTIYAKSTAEANLTFHGPNNSTVGRYGLALGYHQTVDPDVLLVQVFPTGSTGRSFNTWLTDSSGNQAGFPTGDANPVSAIPGSTASIDALSISSPDSAPEEDIQPSSFPYAIMIVNPPSDVQVHIVGQAPSSTYRLQYTRFHGGQQTSSDLLNGTVAAGESKTVPVVPAAVAAAQTVQVRQETAKTIQLAATDPSGRSLTFAIATQPVNGTLSAIDATGKVVYTPTTGFTGSDSFTFTANNGVLDSRPATVTITVNPNSPPVATDGTAATDENQPVAITLTGSAPSGQPITFAASQPANGTVTVSGATATYTPSRYFFGTDSFTFTVNDGYLTSASATVTITVRHVNQPAVVTLTAPQSVNEGAAPASITANIAYPDSDPSTVQWTTTLGTLVANGTSATFSADDGPATATVRLTVTTSHGLTTVAQATIQVVNVPPTVSVGSAQTQFWGLPVNLTGSATDPSAADTAAGLNPSWSFGDGTANAAGYSVTHAYANPGSYTATLTATDKDGGVGSATVGVTVKKRGSTLSYAGSTAAPYGFVTLSAKLADAVDGPSARLAGHRVTFIVGTQAFAATSDSTGTATVTPSLIAPGSYQVVVAFSADSLYLSSIARATLVVSNSAGSATGTGLTLANGGTASFSVTSTGSTVSGTLDYANGSTVAHVTSLAPFGIRPDGHAAWFNGVDSLGRKITVYVEDNGSTATDVFKLSINGVAQTGNGSVTGGTLQIVKT